MGGGEAGVHNVLCPVILWVIVVDCFRLQKASSARLSCLTVKQKKKKQQQKKKKKKKKKKVSK